MIAISIFWTSAVQAEAFYKIQYVGGAPSVKDDKEMGSLDIAVDKITFWTGDPGTSKELFSFPTSTVTDVVIGKRAKRRVGSGVGYAVLLGPLGLAAMLTKKKNDVVVIEFKDPKTKEGGAPTFLVPRDHGNTIKVSLEAKTGKEFKDELMYDETKKGERKE